MNGENGKNLQTLPADEILRRVIDADKIASESLSEAKAERDNANLRIAVYKSEIQKRVDEREAAKLKKIEDEESAEADRTIKNIKAALSARLEKLSSTALQKEDEWVSEMYKLVTKR